MQKTKINYFHFCDAATIDTNGKVNVLGIFDRINIPAIPYKHPRFTILFNMEFKNIETEDNNVEIKIFKPDGKELEITPNLVLELKIDQPDKKSSGNFNLLLDIANMEFKDMGVYTFMLYFNHNNIGKRELFVTNN